MSIGGGGGAVGASGGAGSSAEAAISGTSVVGAATGGGASSEGGASGVSSACSVGAAAGVMSAISLRSPSSPCGGRASSRLRVPAERTQALAGGPVRLWHLPLAPASADPIARTDPRPQARAALRPFRWSVRKAQLRGGGRWQLCHRAAQVYGWSGGAGPVRQGAAGRRDLRNPPPPHPGGVRRAPGRGGPGGPRRQELRWTPEVRRREEGG